MSVSKSKRQEIERAIKSRHQPYSCIAHRYGVSIEEVRRIGKPIQQKRWQEYKAKKELERMTSNVVYNRRPYPTLDDEYERANQIIKVSILIALAVLGCLILFAIFIGCICLAVGV